jgi:hypothetical protein
VLRGNADQRPRQGNRPAAEGSAARLTNCLTGSAISAATASATRSAGGKPQACGEPMAVPDPVHRSDPCGAVDRNRIGSVPSASCGPTAVWRWRRATAPSTVRPRWATGTHPQTADGKQIKSMRNQVLRLCRRPGALTESPDVEFLDKSSKRRIIWSAPFSMCSVFS